MSLTLIKKVILVDKIKFLATLRLYLQKFNQPPPYTNDSESLDMIILLYY